MKGDFTRDSFDPFKHFSRVLMQQGRVQLDADWNEQTAILLHYLRTLVTDLIGPCAAAGDGFKITAMVDGKDFTINPGHYYVDGILCENDQIPGAAFTNQHHYPSPPTPEAGTHLVFLDVWERHVNCLEDNEIREVALGGPDTATRAQVVWQVKVVKVDENQLKTIVNCSSAKGFLESNLETISPARLKARARKGSGESLLCSLMPEARYRGAENQLYRVEIHHDDTNNKPATFKWSRENGSVVFPVLGLASDAKVMTARVTLAHLGRDPKFSLAPGDWIELVDDDYTLQNRAEPLLQVLEVHREDMAVTLQVPEDAQPPNISSDPGKHPLLRRWDHKADQTALFEGALRIPESLREIPPLERRGLSGEIWRPLEDGVEIRFSEFHRKAVGGVQSPKYRTGDYWLIPARTATGDVEWPKELDSQGNYIPKALQPHGIEHHYAPLAVITVDNGKVTEAIDYRWVISSPISCKPRQRK